MKQILYILIVFFSLTLYGQNKDKRAELYIPSRSAEISVSPNEKIWLITYNGQTYFTNSIDSIWHCGYDFSKKTDNKPVVDKMTFFNNDTAIMTGYISYNQSIYKKNGLYLTKDGGQTWNIVDFGGDEWIYTTFVDKKGNSWIAGSSKELYYSMNFGVNWEVIHLPYEKSERTHTIYMIDSESGFAGGESNELFYTTDNWKSVTTILTPFDQNKYKVRNYGYSRGESINKIIQWKNYLVIRQSNNIFYTDIDTIDWKSFSVAIKFFEKDKESDNLYAITRDGYIIQFLSPTEYIFIAENQVQNIKNIKVENESIYLLTEEYDIYKVNKNEFIYITPYTNDYKIKEPYIIKKSDKFLWGATGKNLYIAGYKRYWFMTNWYRLKKLDFFVSDITVINDSLIVLWDGHKNNYKYSLKDDEVSLFILDNPLKDFLAKPLKSISISSGYASEYGEEKYNIDYTVKNDTIFTPLNISSIKYEFESYKHDDVNFKNDISVKLLEEILMNISLNPYEIPSIKDFLITESDVNNFFNLVDEEIAKNKTDYLNRNKYVDRDFYYSIPSKLDTISSSIMDDIINHKEVGWSSIREWFKINIINQNNDTLKISKKYSIRILPWNLPWIIEYKGLKLNCYSIEFSRFINSCMPESFRYKEAFDNKHLIMSIANYLWNKED
ncbi:MAG: hypothetical protein GX259_01490 [Bacteroidales bacterium]|nr:hypothetical protein [Bacteroidales bacterium]